MTPNTLVDATSRWRRLFLFLAGAACMCVIFWAWLLGPTGAILAVPLTVVIQEFWAEEAEQSQRASLRTPAENVDLAATSPPIATSTLP